LNDAQNLTRTEAQSGARESGNHGSWQQDIAYRLRESGAAFDGSGLER
jgi:hypothetical protein